MLLLKTDFSSFINCNTFSVAPSVINGNLKNELLQFRETGVIVVTDHKGGKKVHVGGLPDVEVVEAATVSGGHDGAAASERAGVDVAVLVFVVTDGTANSESVCRCQDS